MSPKRNVVADNKEVIIPNLDKMDIAILKLLQKMQE